MAFSINLDATTVLARSLADFDTAGKSLSALMVVVLVSSTRELDLEDRRLLNPQPIQREQWRPKSDA